MRLIPSPSLSSIPNQCVLSPRNKEEIEFVPRPSLEWNNYEARMESPKVYVRVKPRGIFANTTYRPLDLSISSLSFFFPFYPQESREGIE